MQNFYKLQQNLYALMELINAELILANLPPKQY